MAVTLEILGKTTGIRANFEMPTGAPGRGVTTTPTTSTARTVIERSCTTQSAHGSGAVQKTTAYEPKYSDDTTRGVQVNLAVKEDCINEGIMRTRARVP